ncbi:hypothetical protein [Zobellia uliginosa]|nr:hypothetical protein [Zobellia uliginosa]MDO6519067.1 hypothetical protein [Zobellia uliginosa]
MTSPLTRTELDDPEDSKPPQKKAMQKTKAKTRKKFGTPILFLPMIF